MAENYPHGQITWTDISVPDVQAGKAFYAELMGWDAEDQFYEDQLVYTMFSKDGKVVAGLGRQSYEMQNQGIPPMWTTYVNVDDVDAVAKAFTDHGGNLIVAPMDVMGEGRMAYGMDPSGAAIGFWRPLNHKGADHFNDPGFITWNELVTRDVEGSKKFWEAVLPWTVTSTDMGEFVYHMIKLGDRPNAGLMAMDESFPEAIPAHWMVYFWVADIESAITKVTELGGTIPISPFDTPEGKVAVVNDPQGGTSSLIGPAPQS